MNRILEAEYRTYSKDITKKSDLVIILWHWNLIHNKNGNCLSDDQTKTETLPSTWNTNECYFIKYELKGIINLLSGIRANSYLILNWSNNNNEIVQNCVIDLDSINSNYKTEKCFYRIIPTYKKMLDSILKQFDDITPLKKNYTCNDVIDDRKPNPNTPIDLHVDSRPKKLRPIRGGCQEMRCLKEMDQKQDSVSNQPQLSDKEEAERQAAIDAYQDRDFSRHVDLNRDIDDKNTPPLYIN